MSEISELSRLISQGRYLEARHIAEKSDQHNVDVRKLHSLALSKSGMPEEALEHLAALYQEFPDDSETAGILGSIYKELFKKNRSTSFALKARDTYLKNFLATQNYYTGINAASMSAMIMQGSKSKEIARQVISLINADSTDFWELATLGEANLLTKQAEKSVEFYIKARKVAGNDWGKIGSVYNQLWLLNHYLPVQKEILRIFSPPGIVAFVGHMIDHPSRSVHRFPVSIEKLVKEAIISNLKTINAHIGFCSLACGSDILFAEAMVSMNRELNIFLPFRIPDFIDASVAFAGEEWVQRFKKLIEVHSVNIITEEPYAGYDPLFNFQSKIIFGSAILRSQAQRNKITLLTVLSETDLKKKIGGTNYSLNLWPFPDKRVNINPDIFLESQVLRSAVLLPEVAGENFPNRKIWSHLSIDVLGLSPLYVEKVHKEVTRINSAANPFLSTEISKSITVYSIDSEFGVFDLVSHFQNVIKTFPKDQYVSIYIHAGLTTENESKLSGEGIETVIELSHLAMPGIRASEHVAAMLALQSNKYSLDLEGPVILRNKTKMTIYRVGLPVRIQQN